MRWGDDIHCPWCGHVLTWWRHGKSDEGEILVGEMLCMLCKRAFKVISKVNRYQRYRSPTARNNRVPPSFFYCVTYHTVKIKRKKRRK